MNESARYPRKKRTASRNTLSGRIYKKVRDFAPNSSLSLACAGVERLWVCMLRNATRGFQASTLIDGIVCSGDDGGET